MIIIMKMIADRPGSMMCIVPVNWSNDRSKPTALAAGMLALLLLLPVQVRNGSTDCACVNPFTNISALGDPSCPLRRASDGVCFPATYGAQGCFAYDGFVPNTTASNTPECTPTLAQPAPAWCESSWCYVDPAQCWRPNELTDFFPNFDSALYYSYEACACRGLDPCASRL